jgi:hypothetical protein
MNDLNEIWGQEDTQNDVLQEMLQNKSFTKGSIHSPLAKLKKNLFVHIIYAVVITLAYAFVIYYFPFWQVQFCMLLLIGFNFWAISSAYRLYKNVDPDLTHDNVLTELKKHYYAFSDWQKQSMRVALFIYPFAGAGGFMLGGAIGSGKTPEAFMADYRIMIALGITLLVLVPLCYWMAKWMNRVAFGKLIKQLKERIDELEKEG